MNTMTFDVELNLGFDDTIQQVEAALKAEQFGIISRIDLHMTFKQKLDVDGLPHTILGACNPKLAHKAVSAMPAAAVMLPCNVTVQAIENKRTIVRMVSPAAVLALAGLENEPVVRQVSEEADTRLKRIAQALAVR
ncbi:MAG: DUF302 domain-containing protein [Desulfobacterales bacterium]|jgi:uncharacterized protein (DUF302 family)